MHFARDAKGAFTQYAVKFSNTVEDHMRELAFYKQPSIQDTLPPLHFACANADGVVASPGGFAYPPFIVTERGLPCTECVSFSVAQWHAHMYSNTACAFHANTCTSAHLFFHELHMMTAPRMSCVQALTLASKGICA